MFKMEIFVSDSKSQVNVVELINYIILIVLLAFSVYMINNSNSRVINDLKLSVPELAYQFPAVSIKSFLYFEVPKSKVDVFFNGLELSDDEFEILNKLKKRSSIRVIDLLYYSNVSTENLNRFINSLRDEYLDMISKKNVLDFYSRFSNESDLRYDDIIEISVSSEIPNNEVLIKEKNYAFYFLNNDGSNVVVRFKE